MSPNAKIGLALMALSAVGLFVEYGWREKVGRPTAAMIQFWLAMVLPMIVGVVMFLDQFGWHVAVRIVVGIVGGPVLWLVVYAACGIIWSIVAGASGR